MKDVWINKLYLKSYIISIDEDKRFYGFSQAQES
jgi:hypothetical protein